MRRACIALGILVAAISLLMCWPLVQLMVTHRVVPGQVLCLLPEPIEDGRVRLHLRYRFASDAHTGHIGERQADRFFRVIEAPIVDADEADQIIARFAPDNAQPVRVWFRVNDPGSTSFIVDVSAPHPMRRYVFGLLLTAAGLVTTWLAWRRGRWEPAT
jgi:hypothetical protein